MSALAPSALRSPFLAQDSFVAAEAEAPPARTGGLPPRPPFLALYGAGGRPQADAPLREAFAALVDELHDEEFDESLARVHDAARAFHDGQLAQGRPRDVADRLLAQRFDPLLRETVAMVDAAAERFGAQETAGFEQHEVAGFVDRYAPREPLEPEFENFFGKLLKKVGKVVKSVAGKAMAGIAKLGLAPALAAIRSHLMQFLKRMLQRVLGRLPAAVQPYARKLAQRLGFAAPAPAPAPAPVNADTPAAPDLPAPAGDATDPQQELDERLAGALLAAEEAELEYESADGGHAAEAPAVPVYAELDEARERFIGELAALKEGASPQPAMENFLPALLPALGIVKKVVGHDRLVGLVSGLLAPLVSRLIGGEGAAALSRSLADTGLRALNLEAPEQGEEGEEGEAQAPAGQALVPAALAATVEEAAARIAALPPEVHEDPQLMEAFAVEAFEGAAAANLPALFNAQVYRRRPELLEAGLDAAWPLQPALRGPRRYKRCGHRFMVRITPHMAHEVESFEGAPLADHLHDQLGLADAGEVEAELRLYESLPGTTLGDIARAEREWLGPGRDDESNAALLHPLTPQAAAVLLGRPGLGRAWRPGSRHRPLGAGQRFYALRVPGAVAPPGRRRALRLRVTLDVLRGQARVSVLVSEAKAQQIAVALRQKTGAGALAARFDRWLARRLWHHLFGHARHRVRIVHANLPPGEPAARRLQQLPPAAAQALLLRLRGWLVAAFGEALGAQSAAIVAATENAADGIGLHFRVDAMPGLKELGELLDGKGSPGALVQALGADAKPQVTLAVQPGQADA